VRVPTSITSSNLLWGAMAVHTQYGDRSRRWSASSSRLLPTSARESRFSLAYSHP
jgi:hypothetical protein